MSGPGIALRLHEFKERQDPSINHQPTHIAQRQGRDVTGLYPGQLGRVYTFTSQFYRSTLKSLEPQMWCNKSRVKLPENYQRSFDHLTLQALDRSKHRGRAETRTTSYKLNQHHTPLSTYQVEFSSQAHLYDSGVSKFTLSSHPDPPENQQKSVIYRGDHHYRPNLHPPDTKHSRHLLI